MLPLADGSIISTFLNCKKLFFCKIRRTFLQEIEKLDRVGIVGEVLLRKAVAVGIDDDVVGLRVHIVVRALEEEVAAAEGLDGALAVFDPLAFGKRDVVHVAIELTEHIVVVHILLHLVVAEHILLHLAAVVAVDASEVDEDGLARLAGVGLSLLDVEEALVAQRFMQLVGIFAVGGYAVVADGADSGTLVVDNNLFDIEVLRVHRRQEARNAVERSAPQTGNHIDCKAERGDGEEQSDDADVLQLLVAFELKLAEQVDAHQGEDDNPEGQVNLAVQDAPAPVEVGHLQEFQSEGQLEEGEDDLDRVEPAARLHVLKHRGKESQQRERQRKTDAETEHRHQADPAVGGRRSQLYQGGANDGTRAGEGDQHRGQRDEEGGQQTTLVGLGVAGVDPLLGHLDFEEAKERQREDKEDDEENEVRDAMRADDVERLGTEEERQDGTQHGEHKDDRESEKERLAAVLALVVAAVHEEIDRHRYHREDAGREHRHDTGQQGAEEEAKDGFVVLFPFAVVVGIQFRGRLGRLGDRHLAVGIAVGDGQRLSDCRRGIARGSRHLEGERCVVGSYAGTIIAELIVHGAFDFEGFVGIAFNLLAESHLVAKRAYDTLKDVVHLLVGFGFDDATHALVVGIVLEGEFGRNRAVGVGLLRVDMPTRVELQLELQFHFVGRQLLDIEFPMGRINLCDGRCQG